MHWKCRAAFSHGERQWNNFALHHDKRTVHMILPPPPPSLLAYMYRKVHDAIHSSPAVNEYPQQTPQNPQVLGTCPGCISSSRAVGVGHCMIWKLLQFNNILLGGKNFWKT